MKRRSARPFTVEIKHTRTSRVSLIDATARTRTSQNVWGAELTAAANATAEVEPTHVPCAEPVRVEAPARRVLPSLVPMFAMPVEPADSEVREASAQERLPRVRRVKPPAKRTKSSAIADVATPVSDEAQAQRQVPTSAVAAIAEADAAGVALPVVAQVRSARRTQQVATLKPGERWKRRLPRALW
ncbi:hypothetical protein [Methylobacterium sp. Leaf111]|uniref:hypothetical protein n=1 Tax=Methylobacterium sp. Leaf111 TaxID=1736257 RepID=UPI0009E955B4|nr:hypothetical protein [Methylobacterium sp. Leaf111]